MLGAQVPDPHHVVRVAENKEHFTGFKTEGQTYVITIEALNFNSVERTHVPKRISVWDLVRTTLAQARVFTAKPRGEAFKALAAAIRALPADVFYDSDVDEAIVGLAGSDGHAGITGLDVGNDTERRLRRKKLVGVLKHEPFHDVGLLIRVPGEDNT